MTNLVNLLLLGSCAALPLVGQAQTAVRKSAPRAVAKPASPTAKPAAKPAPAVATQPAAVAKPAPAPAVAPALAARAASPQAGPFGVGTSVVNLGIGLGNRYSYGTGFFGGSSSVTPAISLSYERGVLPLGPGVLGVGAFVGYQGASYDLGGGDKYKFTDLIVTVRGAFHYPVTPQFDAYGGLALGVRHAGVSFEGSSQYAYGASGASEFASGLFLGGRYFFSDKLGGFAELGYDQTFLKIGLAAKF